MAKPAPSPEGSLPTPRTPLIGRAAERRLARELLLDGAAPLVTLTGPGGAGKTRLALSIAHDVASGFADGAAWVDLAPLSDPALLPATVAQALGVVPVAGLSLNEQLIRMLRPCQVLLLIDNCEHVLHAASVLVAYVLGACPAVQLLATSRAPLRHRGEHELPVDPFPLPAVDAGVGALAENEAVRLFVERARAVDPGFALTDGNAAAVGAICHRLDGLPLAIELAAARTKLLAPDALLARMGDRLRLLRDGPRDLSARQQTIRSTIAWSCALLDAEQRALFRRLSVFAGRWTLDAAVAVAGEGSTSDEVADGIGALLDHSLVRRSHGPTETRFTMLETIREFGLSQLVAAGEDAEIRGRHAEWFRTVVEALGLHRTMQRDAARMSGLYSEQDNLRQALSWFAAQGDGPSLNVMSVAMSIYWPSIGQFAEARTWLHRAIEIDADVPLAIQARVWHEAGWLAMCQGEVEAARPLHERGLSLARQAGEPYLLAEVILSSGTHAFWRGDMERAAALLEEGRQAFEAIGAEFPSARAKAAAAVIFLGNVALVGGDLPRAVKYCAEAVAAARSLNATAELGYSLCGLGYARLLGGDTISAAGCFVEAAALTWKSGDDAFLARLFWAMAATTIVGGQSALAARLIGAADALDASTGGAMWPADRIVAEWCRSRLDDAIDEPTFVALRREGSSLGTRRAMAAVRLAAATVLGEERAETIWIDAGAPDPGVGDRALLHRQATHGDAGDGAGVVHGLTGREREVLDLICRRLDDGAIADRLATSLEAVGGMVASLFDKLGVTNRRDAVAMAARLADEAARPTGIRILTSSQTVDGVAWDGLTSREGDVLLLLIEGRTDREIAAYFGISRRTASKHVEAILSKFGVHTRGAAVAEVLRRGWTPGDAEAALARRAIGPANEATDS